ncbi:hypothetical protein RYZ26_16420 [Terasakiella sp. A23]|uniref:hypothetical protein n=1 Tax=Terasakiella sp. FCG-A23 TaxID=3080561 RepID=UPI00295521AD|nr:hypothetical protein [Terasakiella sp. A23]MDV7341194.1 hypothetical protein [Terasakiella sp. A23]
MLRVRLTKRAIFFHSLLPILVAAYLTWMPWSVPVTLSESFSYIEFSAQHSLGYPVFLNLFELISPERSNVILAQIWIFAFAVFYLSLSVRKNTDSHLLGIIIALPVLFNPFILSTHYTILPHSLFISFSVLTVAFFLSAFGRAWFFNLFGLGTSIGLCIILECFGWVYLVVMILAAPLIARHNQCSYAKAFILPLFFCLALTSLEGATHKALHETKNDRPHAPHIFANAALMETHQTTPYAEKDPRTLIWDMIEKDLDEKRQDIWTSKNFDERIVKLQSIQSDVEDYFADYQITEAAQLLDKTPNELRLDLAHARIIQDPLAFMQMMVDQYRRLWHGERMITYPLWGLTFITLLIGLWCLLTGSPFNAMFAGAFISATIMQCLTLWIAYTGLGPTNIVTLLSPLFSICFLSIILGFYIAFVSPLRHDH